MDIAEEFRDLQIGDRIFQVSNLGKVFRNGQEIRQRENADGYLVVSVQRNKGIGVHRMVAMAFISNENPEIKNEVNHIDFNRKNNIALNLEWLSHVENIRHSASNGRYKGKMGEQNPNYGNHKLSSVYKENPHIALEKQSRKGSQNGKAKRIQLFKDGAIVQTFDYIGDCCKYLNENHGFSSDAEVVRCGIRRSIKTNVPYRGFTFNKI